MTKTIEEILSPKPQVRPQIYAYSIDDKAHAGLLKVGQTTRDVKQRVAEQLKTAAIKNYRIEIASDAVRNDGSFFSDHEVRARLVQKKFENGSWDHIKADYCRKHNISLHIDDTLIYNDFFTTPFARLWSHSNKPKPSHKDVRHLD